MITTIKNTCINIINEIHGQRVVAEYKKSGVNSTFVNFSNKNVAKTAIPIGSRLKFLHCKDVPASANKITLDELIEFNNKNNPQSKRNEKPIGWKVKDEFRNFLNSMFEQATGKAIWRKNDDGVFMYNSEAHHYWSALSVLEVWFDPIYDEQPTFHTIGTEYIKVLDGVAYFNDEDVTEVIKTIYSQLK